MSPHKWGNYARYQLGGGRIRLEEDIRGFTAGDTNDGDISRFYFFCLAFDQLIKEGVRGDFAELGVFAAILLRRSPQWPAAWAPPPGTPPPSRDSIRPICAVSRPTRRCSPPTPRSMPFARWSASRMSAT